MLQEWHLDDKAGALPSSNSVPWLDRQVMCLSFSPLLPALWLAGHSGGVIAVYSLKSSKPLLVTQVGCTHPSDQN